MAKGDPNWWFGPNSVWAKSGLKQHFTGAVDNGEQWKIPVDTNVKLDDETKFVIGGVLIALFLIMK